MAHLLEQPTAAMAIDDTTFEALDADHDGAVSYDELLIYAHNVGGPDLAEVHVGRPAAAHHAPPPGACSSRPAAHAPSRPDWPAGGLPRERRGALRRPGPAPGEGLVG